MNIYRDILKKAWQVLWKHPWLWLLGIVASLAGNGGEYNALINAADRVANETSALGALKNTLAVGQLGTLWESFLTGMAKAPFTVILSIAVTIAIILVVVWLILVAQASLITASKQILQEGKSHPIDAMGSGAKHFGSLFTLHIITKFFVYILLLIAFLPFLLSFLASPTSANWSFDALTIVSFFIYIPLTLMIAFILRYAMVYVVLEGESWWNGLIKAINLFLRHWLVSLEMAGILFAINLVLGIVAYMLIPDTITWDIAMVYDGFTVTGLLRLLPTIAILLAAGSWFATFQYAAWTTLFVKFQTDEVLPKLVRLSDSYPRYLGVLKKKIYPA